MASLAGIEAHIGVAVNQKTLKEMHDAFALETRDPPLFFQADFDGSGDDGQIEEPTLEYEKDAPEWDMLERKRAIKLILNKKYDWVQLELRASKNRRVIRHSGHRIIKSLLEDYVLENSTTDWYNNEGGGGSINLHINKWPWTVDFNVYQYVRQSFEGDDCFSEKSVIDLLTESTDLGDRG